MTLVNRLSHLDNPHVVALLGAAFEQVRASVREADWGGLRPSHLRVLDSVAAEGTNITELAERVGMTKQGCGQFVLQLTETGHLRTAPDPADRRGRIVTLTTKGRRTRARFRGLVEDLELQWSEAIGADRYATFRAVLEDLAYGVSASTQSSVR